MIFFVKFIIPLTKANAYNANKVTNVLIIQFVKYVNAVRVYLIMEVFKILVVVPIAI
jgi:hypothetical protein